MTPAELSIYVHAWGEAQQRGSYMNASLIRLMVGTAISGKRAPSYESIFSKPTDQVAKSTQRMTDRQMYNVVLALNRAFGGSVTGKEVE